MTQCPSIFLGAQCQGPQGHSGHHFFWETSAHITTWDDAAADEAQL